jgi:hypothetical protein
VLVVGGSVGFNIVDAGTGSNIGSVGDSSTIGANVGCSVLVSKNGVVVSCDTLKFFLLLGLKQVDSRHARFYCDVSALPFTVQVANVDSRERIGW